MILKAMDLGKNLIFYDFILIASFGGLVLMEKIYGRPSIGQAPVPDAPPQTDVTAKPRDDKSEAVHP
jgi:hypothetical protein